MTGQTLIVIGEVVKSFGIRGEVKVRPFTESLELFRNAEILFLDGVRFEVTSFRVHKGSPLLALQGVDDPDKAQALRGRLVQTEADRLPELGEDEYYWRDLIGMRVIDMQDRTLGTVSAIIRTGANDVLEVHGDFGEILLPVIDAVVREVHRERNCIMVDPLEGLIPDA
jgi:16S rRNA processing protein RimM